VDSTLLDSRNVLVYAPANLSSITDWLQFDPSIYALRQAKQVRKLSIKVLRQCR